MTADSVTVADWIAAHPKAISARAGDAVVAGVHRPATRLARILRCEGSGAPLAKAVAEFVATARDRGCLTVRCELPRSRDGEAAVLEAAGFQPIAPAVHRSQPDRDVVRLALTWTDWIADRAEPYFSQTTDFTCGAVALMLAGNRLRPNGVVDRRTEVALWRQATTVHAPGGPGGCDPFGLACTASRLGLRAGVVSTTEGPFLLDRAVDERRRDLMRFVQADFLAEARDQHLPIEIRAWTYDDLRRTIGGGGLAIILIAQTQFIGLPTPHWIVAYA
ncbi:MAG: peptidase C39 family protein, partial [Pseudomonadota bacterium]